MYRRFTVLTVLLGALSPAVELRAQPPADAPDSVAVAQNLTDSEPSPLLSEPKDPEALFDAVVLMLDLDRPKLALQYMKQLLDQDPKDATILKMRDKHGPAVFLELSNDKRLQPESITLLDRMNEAFRQYAADPTRMDRLVDNLSGTPQEREVAIIQLRSTGKVAIPRMLTRVASSKDTNQRDAMVYAMTRMGTQIIPPLLGALEAPDEAVQTAAIDTLGWLGSLDTVPWLWYSAFGADQQPGVRQAARQALARILRDDVKRAGDISSFGAASQLQKIATTHFRLEFAWKMNDDGKTTELWSWDAQKNALSAWNVAPETASLIVGSRFAHQALTLAPERQEVQSLYLSLRLAFDAHLAGWDAALPTGPGTAHDLALLSGPEVALRALQYSLQNPNPAAALATLQVLGQIGNRSQLRDQSGQASPIIQAMSYPNFRVQFAAASTVLQLDPDNSFRGASRIVSILTRALNDSGERQGLAIDSNQDRAASMAGLLSEMGMGPLQATTGQDGFKIAADRSDIELIVIHAAVVKWGLGQTITNLRADARTSGIPIVVYGPESVEPAVARLAEQYPMIGFALNGETSFKQGVRLFLSRLSTPPVSERQRAARASAAGFWFAHIAGGRRTETFNIDSAEQALFDAVNDPGVGENAVIALGAIATATSQERLQEIAVSEARDEALRETAALQLAFHMQRYGILLSESRVQEVQLAWQSAPAGPLKTALAAVVGSLKPTSQRITELLQSLPAPAIPTAGE
ncbi:MAG: HEAT repeat domain-containing protein [Planctomycetaceae bacterium]|nr:HEAT repeat domain-containing protein [Planctomycetaceae bacterium]